MQVPFFKLLLRLLLASTLLVDGCWAQLKDNGKTDVVQWDHESLYINGERVFIFAGEFHYPRLPVPDLWLDIFQKLRASGFNAVSIYFFWSFHSDSPDSPIDLSTGARDIQLLFDHAKTAGIWIITRSGPYINAETAAGGVALWSTTGGFGTPRTNDEAYHEAWLPWITAVGEVFAKNGVDKGGMAILNQHENEFNEDVHDPDAPGVLYMEQIKAAFDDAGVTVPSSHNEKGMRAQSWSTDFEDVGGAVNIYGLDSYPNGFNCANPTGGFNVVKTYYQWFSNYSFTQPEYMPEYQGGAFDPWGGFGYENCALLTGTQFSDVFYKTLVAQKVTLLSLYMAYGGTNWGGLAAPVVYTAYDYGSHLSESRVTRDKMRQTKLLGLFVRVSEDLRGAVMRGNGTSFTTDNTISTIHLRNPDTNAGYYWVVHATSSSTASTTFGLNAETSLGNLTIPNIELNGRQSKFVVTDYTFGDFTLLYSSGEILTYADFGGANVVLLLYLDPGQTGEFVLKDSTDKPQVFGTAGVNSTIFSDEHIKVTYTQSSGKTVLQFPDGPQIWLVDRVTGWNTFAPSLTTSPNTHANEHILVLGPALVRTASISGSTAHLTGDVNATTTIEISAPKNITSITWNGASLPVNSTSYGSLTGSISGPSSIESLLPDLSSLTWKAADSLPERLPSYNASSWVVANHNTTQNPQPPKTTPVLYPDDYGFHNGYRLYRGTFTSGSSTPSVTLDVIGGSAFGFSVWVNGEFLHSFLGDPDLASTNVTVSLGNATLKATGNVLFVIQDDAGRDEDSVSPDGVLNPRGISQASLSGGAEFTEWRVVGNAGGEAPVDTVRGIFNEGGLRAERLGWPLPGFDDASWDTKSPLTGLSSAGIEFYRSTFTLDLPKNYDVPLSVAFSASDTVPARIQLYINGYQYGKYIPHIGPQTVFPVPPGIINNNGENTIGVSIWAQDDTTGAKLDGIELVADDGVFVSGYEGGFGFDASELQPGWTDVREKFA